MKPGRGPGIAFISLNDKMSYLHKKQAQIG